MRDDEREVEQRVIDDTPIITITRLTDAPAIIESRNPTAKQALKNTPRLHLRVTRNNTPGIFLIKPLSQVPIVPTAPCRSTRTMPSMARQRLVTQHGINALTIAENNNLHDIFSPQLLLDTTPVREHVRFKHFACPMLHPTTGETITSYKRLMHDPAMAETWQTALGKDFGGMAQVDNKTGQKGTNAMFVMTHNEIHKVLTQGKKLHTYGNPVVNYCPHREDPNKI